jgi:uncharacterized protein (TIGR02271 family)
MTPRDEPVVRHEETLRVDAAPADHGTVRLRKHVDTEHVAEHIELGSEDATLERVPPAEHDSGQIETLPDGSISVPLFVEELVIEKRLVVRERVIVRKRTEVEQRVVHADLRRERLEIDADDGIAVRETPVTDDTT